MHSAPWVRWSGLSAMLGGVVWGLWAILVAGKPEGCVGSECDLPGTVSRGYSDLIPLLTAAVLLIATGVVGLVVHARAVGRFGRLGQWGLGLGTIGVVILAAALIIQSLFYAGDFPLMPLFVIPGGVAVAAGFVLFAITILRVIPRWAGVLLGVGALALLGVNDQNERILLAVPFGAGWIAVGWVLWSGTTARN